MPCCSASGRRPADQAELPFMAEIFPAAGKTACQPGRIFQHGRNMALLLVDEPAYQVESACTAKVSPCLVAKWPANQNNISLPLAKPSASHPRSLLPTESADWFSNRQGVPPFKEFCLIDRLSCQRQALGLVSRVNFLALRTILFRHLGSLLLLNYIQIRWILARGEILRRGKLAHLLFFGFQVHLWQKE